jgi:hypothetical protein
VPFLHAQDVKAANELLKNQHDATGDLLLPKGENDRKSNLFSGLFNGV